MAENKTKTTGQSPEVFIAELTDPIKQQDANTLIEICERTTGQKAVMWGNSIVGCGSYHYKYESGREGDMLLAGFSPRKAALVVYLIGNIPDQSELLKKLGKHKMGKACLYIKRLEHVDLDILEELITKSTSVTLAKYPAA